LPNKAITTDFAQIEGRIEVHTPNKSSLIPSHQIKRTINTGVELAES